ncbi:MAG: DISARM system phospholipase D-like protein DrmC [Phycisphaerae bacterium]
MNMAIWPAISTSVLNDICHALRSGRLSPPFAGSALPSTVPADQAHAVISSLRELTANAMNCEQIAAILDLLIEDRRSHPSVEDTVDLVLSGPEGIAIASRDTLVVVNELFSQAANSILVVGYAVYQGESIFQSLAENMSRKPALAVEMFLDIQRPPGNIEPERELVANFRDRIKRDQWPQSAALPAIYYFPASLDHSTATRAALHAKCIVADRKIAWISSANFTAAAQKRNIEVGVLIRAESVAARLSDHFDLLKQRGVLARIV